VDKQNQKESLGQRLQRLRQEAGLTQAELARRSGQSLPNLRNWEQDYRTPGLWAALQLARVLGVALEDLAVCAEPVASVPRERNKRPRAEGGRPRGRPPKGQRNAGTPRPDPGQDTARSADDQEKRRPRSTRRARSRGA
jgi:transcriptional regulator with XRE-family HTH domain